MVHYLLVFAPGCFYLFMAWLAYRDYVNAEEEMRKLGIPWIRVGGPSGCEYLSIVLPLGAGLFYFSWILELFQKKL